MSELAASIACWYAFWFACYKLSHVANGILFETYGALKPATQAYWCASSVSSLHAIVIVYLSFTRASSSRSGRGPTSSSRRARVPDLSLIHISEPTRPY